MLSTTRSFYVVVFLSLLAATNAAIALVPKDGHRYNQDHVIVGKRQYGSLPPSVPATTTFPGVLTYITPSPGATPVAVTTESQIVTSYIPQFTLCELPPIAYYSLSSVSQNGSSTSSYPSYSVFIPPGNGTCTTIFEPTQTMVCATTLTGLDKQYTVTNCNQEIAFSTEYGYVLVPPTPTSSVNSSATNAATITPAPTIATLTTYYLAPWQQLTDGTAPTEVDLEVCRGFPNGTEECIREYQVWSTSLVTQSTTTVTSINISTTIHGASQLIIETFVANVTEMLTTFSMSTTMNLEFQTEYITTNSANRTLMATSTAPGVYETVTVQFAPTSTPPSSAMAPASSGIAPATGQMNGQATGQGSAQPTGQAAAQPSATDLSNGGGQMTTTIHVTSTIVAGTSTVTVQGQPAPASPASANTGASMAAAASASSSVDFASMLGA